jgi:hypothetical protein
MSSELFGAPQGSFVTESPIEICPVCGSDRVFAVSGDHDKYRCDACARCWSPGARGPRRVDPVTCPGCRDREACFELLRAEFPPWGTAILD